VDLVEHYAKEQGLFRTAASPDPEYTDVLDLDLGTVEPSIAGPKRPHDRIPLRTAKESFLDLVESKKQKDSAVRVTVNNQDVSISNGSVIIAAITSCTNTSNPSVMIAAGLVAKRAVELGLHVPAYVKTSLAPGSRVVTRYLQGAGLMPYLEALGFHLVGYGCTTCIGNSGPLDPNIVKAIEDHDLVVASVLSGNRNFEGRIHPESRANYLASPPLVVAYALAGSMNVNLSEDAIGSDPAGTPVFLRDVWPSAKDVADAMDRAIGPELFREEYAHVFTGNETWNQVRVTQSSRYEWQPTSTYIRKPTFFDGLTPDVPETKPIEGARVLAYLGDSVTTDHISPAGTIPRESPASRWLTEHGVKLADFNTFGSRRGNHEVMIRGTFGNIRIKNRLVPGIEGGYTKHLPSGEDLPIFDAAARYAENDTPLLVLAGKEYGSGSSRDWAAKGTVLLNVRAVLAESYERIHRSNLIGMGVLPLQFAESDTAESLGLDGTEEFSIETVERPQQSVQVVAKGADGSEKRFTALARIDTDVELRYYRNGGILHTVLRDMVRRG
jgi:aconitate hydratase